MKNVRASSSVLAATLLASLALTCLSAHAGVQWKWKDASGAIQYSDRPPPAGTPDKDILARPAASARAAARAADAAASAAAASAPAAAASKNGDAELEAKRKKADEEKQAKQKAEDEKIARQKADNCQRARNYQRSLNDGLRIVRTNNKGEREILDDKGRAEEMQRNQEAINANCN
jgi:hypothetical protein